MLTFLDDTAADELDGQLEGSMMACVWLHGGDYYVLTNTDRSVAAHILAGAVLEAITQGNETAQ